MKASAETREKMRQAHLGHPVLPETIEKTRLAHLGSKHSPEAIEKIRQATLKRWMIPEYRERMRQANLGKKLPLETREKLRQASLGNKYGLGHRRFVSPETREKLRQASLGRKHSPEERERMRVPNLQNRLRQRFPLTDIELILRAEFKKRRLRFEMHKSMFGRFQPDFVFGQSKLVVQADGGYWHNRRNPRNARSVTCDDAFNAEAAIQGWAVFRFSDTEIKMHGAACARAVARFVRDHRP
jgi:very-short-patch-repair endonuclease